MALNHFVTRIVAGVKYLVHPQVLVCYLTSESVAGLSTLVNANGRLQATVVETISPDDIQPVVLLGAHLLEEPSETVIQELASYEQIDDVFSKAFAEYAIVPGRESAATHGPAWGNLSGLYHLTTDSSTNLPQGPYFLHGSNIHQAWRLYQDDLDAFIFGVIPEDVLQPETFKPVTSVTDDGMWKEVAVPSRLYSRVTPEKPLAGARVSLKDIFHLSGVKTTMSSRDYTELCGPRKHTGEYVKALIQKGAIVIGETKMTQFASSDEPTDQWIDFHCPVNPRGDKYQSPSGSSSGAAASLAGYPWVDFSVAGDSAGSVRAPATCNGLYSIRPSFGSTSTKGVVINSRLFDVVGFFSRDLADLHHLVSSTTSLDDKSTKFPSRILYPLDFFPHSNATHQAMVDEFIGILEDFLETKRIEFSIAERWEKCPPREANGKSLKYAFWPMCYDYYHGFDDFRNDFKAKYGKKAYQGPIVQFRWGVGKAVTSQDYKTYTAELKVFRDWFNENIMTRDDDTLSDAIMIMPYGSANPKYRDAPNEAAATSHTIGEKFISPVLHAPQVVLSFGQMPYNSRISKTLEHRPIGSTLVGAKGSDLMLLKLAKAAFDKAAWPTTINTGRYMFPLGDNVRNVASAKDAPAQGGYLRAQAMLRGRQDGGTSRKMVGDCD